MRRNTLVGGGLAATIVGMVGLSFAAVPLYRVFCAATGYGGTPQIGGAAGPGAQAASIRCGSTPTPAPACRGNSRPSSA